MNRQPLARLRRSVGALVAAAVLAPAGAALSAAPASAAENVWDRLAMCESSGDWAINTGNGYFGGLQFSVGSWKYYGGAKFAARPDLATKKQQIAIARQTWLAQGWAAWPGCTKKLGLLAPPPGLVAPTGHHNLDKYKKLVLRKGSKGAAVKAVQKRLGVEQAGTFGPKTHKAVWKFQKAHGLKPSGIVGKRTWRLLAA